MSAISDAMKNLTSQYYNAIVTQLKLSDQQFQLAQGNVAVGTTSQNVWNLMDAIPPSSIVNKWTGGGGNTLSSQYGALITRIQDTATNALQAALGDYWIDWQTYLRAHPPTADKTIIEVYTGWAYSCGMPPDQANRTVGLFQAAMNGPVTQANCAWAAAGGQTGIKAYTQTVEIIDTIISGAPGGTVTLNTQTQSSDTSHSWAKGGIEGFFEAFFGSGQSSYDSVSSLVIDSQLDFKISFEHVSTVPVTPLSKGTVTAGPNTYKPWYVPSALGLAYANNNNNTWQAGTPDWTTFFGPKGVLPRATISMIVVDGISINITSAKSINESSRTEIEATFKAGFFPFFSISGSGGWDTSSSFTDNGVLNVTSSCKVGNPQVLGIMQSPISSYVSEATLRAAMRGEHVMAMELQSGGDSSSVRAMEGSNQVCVVNIIWTSAATQGLNLSTTNPNLRELFRRTVNTWAENNAPHWNMGVQYQWQSVGRTATAELGAVSGGNRTVHIVNFV